MGRRREKFAPPDETQDLIGVSFRGRPVVDTRIPYVDFDPERGVLIFDTEKAQDYGVSITYEPDTEKVVVTDET